MTEVIVDESTAQVIQNTAMVAICNPSGEVIALASHGLWEDYQIARQRCSDPRTDDLTTDDVLAALEARAGTSSEILPSDLASDSER